MVSPELDTSLLDRLMTAKRPSNGDGWIKASRIELNDILPRLQPTAIP